jgi:adenylosuccinate lyase
MQMNVGTTHGLFFSEKVLLALIESGLTRPEAYGLVQRNALRSWETGMPLRQLLAQDPDVASRLSEPDLDRIFDVNGFLHSIDIAFERLGLVATGDSDGAPAVEVSATAGLAPVVE